MSAPKILMVAGDAAESLEVLYPYQRLQEEGYEVQIAAPSKKKLHFVVHDFEPGYDTYTEKPGYSWDADLAFKDVKPDDYVALVIPGGRAPEYIRNDADLQKIIRHFFQREKPVAQLCHAPLALAAAGVLKGRKSAAYPALAPGVGGLLDRRDRLELRLAKLEKSADQAIELLAFFEDQFAGSGALLCRQLIGLQHLSVAIDDGEWRAQVVTQLGQFADSSLPARNQHGCFLHQIALYGRFGLSIGTFALSRATLSSL